jgi:hypothetical protein
MTGLCERCLAFAIARRAHWPQGHRIPHVLMCCRLYVLNEIIIVLKIRNDDIDTSRYTEQHKENSDLRHQQIEWVVLFICLLTTHTEHEIFYKKIVFTTCLVHTLTSRNLPMFKDAYKSYIEVRI